MTDLAGRQFQDYLIEEEVGRGGMARVYRARHRVLDRVSALKVLLPELAGDEKFVERFLREARAAARLDHPNIVPIYESGRTDDGHYFLAMKYVGPENGRPATLRQVVTSDAPDLQAVAAYVSQIASAMDYAHDNGIVHRDIKPGNILIDTEGRALLTDFGVAQAAEDVDVTSQGMLVGTPAYISPEQAQGFPATSQSDIYALGIVLYELLTGTTPFPHRTPHAILLGHISEPPLPVHDRNPDLTPEVSAVVGKALEKSPEDRHHTAGEFAEDLLAAAGVGLSTPLPDSPASQSLPGDQAPVSEGTPERRLPSWTRMSAGGRMFAVGALALAAALVLSALLFAPDLFSAGSSAEPSRLSINSLPAGAEITINGQPAGTTPRTITDLPDGEHVVRAELPSFAPAEQRIRVGDDADEDEISLVLQPLPAAETIQVTRATMTRQIETNAQGVDAPVDGAVEFQPDEVAIAFAFVVSSAHEVRDIKFTFQSRWYDPSGTLRATSQPTEITLDRSGQVWHLSASDRAGDIDPLASGEPCTVELLVDDVVVQTLQFRVVGRA